MSAIVSLAEIAPAQSSFVYDGSQAHAVALTPEVEDMLRANCVVAIGVSVHGFLLEAFEDEQSEAGA
jgi:hypothetical protein